MVSFKMNFVVISFTKNGDKIAEIIKENINCIIFKRLKVKEIGMNNVVEKYFKKGNCLIFISSTGIAVRAIASFIKSKDIDPAVLVVDSTGRFVISLLSGHLGGANDATLKIASYIKAQPIITTATDNMGIIAPDIIAKKNGYIIDDLKKAKEIASMIVNFDKVFYAEDYVEVQKRDIKIPLGYIDNIENASGVLVVTNKEKVDFNIPFLKLINKNIILGIGCKRGISSEFMREKVLEVLCKYNIDKRAIKTITTVEVKKDEEAILKLAGYFKASLDIISIKDIKKIHNRYNGSDFVEKVIGIRAVAEPCVNISGGEIIVPKLKLGGITLCIGFLK